MTQPQGPNWHGAPPQWQQPYQPVAYPPPYPPPYAAVTRERKRTSHGLHLFLTIITFGMWGIFVWAPITLWHAWGPKRRTVTEYR